MDRIRLPVAADSTGDMDTKSEVASPRYFTNSPHGVRPRKSSIAPGSLGCLSLLDKGDKVARPRAVPSPGLGDENSVAYARIQAQPTVHVHRPRAVLSSPENDELSAEIQGPDKHTNAENNVPKAPLSPLEELRKVAESPVVELPKAPLSTDETLVPHGESTSLGLSEISAVIELPKAPLSSETSAVVELPKAPLSSDESMSVSSSEISSSMTENIEQDFNVSKLENLVHNTTSEETKLQPCQDGVPDPTLAKRNSSDNHHHHHHSKTNGTSRIAKKHSCLPSNTSNAGVKQKPIKSTTKGNNGRVIRPWY